MFNFQKSRVYFVITIILFSFLSCKQEDSVLKTTEKKSDFSDSDSKETILGQRLKNPYSVSVFREAQKNLKERSRISELVDVQATHYYVRFLPKDGVEFEELKKLDLVLFDYPMDYEIKTSGTHYHDPSVAENEITWQYCVVKTEFKFPQIQHEKLEELFLYTFEDKNANARTSVNQELYEILEQETFKLTGNEQEKKENARTTASCGGNWKPEATIKVFDDIKGLIPVQGVKVRFRRWFEAYEKPTDSYGVARCPAAFRREVNFAVIWETESGWFDLRHGNYGQASLNGPQQCGNWSYDFYKNSFYWPYGIAFNAAWYYYTQHSTFGIKQPPSDRGILKQRLHIGIHNSEFTSAHYFQFSRLWQSAQIDLYYKDKVGYNSYASQDVLSTSIHELTHASHWEIYNLNSEWVGQSDGGRWMIESWADAVMIYLTRGYYRDEKIINNQWVRKTNPSDGDWYEDDNKNYPHYSALYEDLIDDFNQSVAIYSNNNVTCPLGSFLRYQPILYAGISCAECERLVAPIGTSAFVYPDNKGSLYFSGSNCGSLGVSDGYNCHVMDIPNNNWGYVRNNTLFLEPNNAGIRPNDHVSGYTLGQIESLFYKKPRNAADLKRLLKSELDNSTEKYLDEYFANYGY